MQRFFAIISYPWLYTIKYFWLAINKALLLLCRQGFEINPYSGSMLEASLGDTLNYNTEIRITTEKSFIIQERDTLSSGQQKYEKFHNF